MKKSGIGAGDIALLAVSVIFLIGILTIFAPCAPKEDGSWMACHWAGRAGAGAAAALAAIALIHILVTDAKAKLGLDLAAIPVALLAMAIPGGLIHLCMMGTMRCRAVMRPAVLVFAALTIAAAVFDALAQCRK